MRWGRPERKRFVRTQLYLQYPASVWDLPDFRHPDVILVDGRFRIACILTAMERITRPTRLLFDDYGTRDYGRVVERFATPTMMVERMAVFDLAPRRLTRFERLRTLHVRLDPN